MLASDGNTALYPRIHIYNSAGSVVATLNLTHVAEGMYTSSWTPALEGWFTAVGNFYSDSGHTTLDTNYLGAQEDIYVSSIKDKITRLLGLVQENTVMDNQVYDISGNLTSSRVRTYDTKAHAQAAGVTGLVATYTMTASYSGSQLTNYSVVLE
jgi:hypothetical protein